MNAQRADIRGGEVVGGHYRLERLLAEGGMGVVWVAHDLRLGRSVAVKFLGAGALSSPLQRERFAREGRLASKIRSPHVVQIIGDGVTAGDVPFVVMELLDGESLASHLAREGRCSLATCGVVVEQVCRALRSAHALQLVHRDIKPANIFLTPQSEGDLFVRLLDFGIAKELLRSPVGLTQSGEVLGTAYYMSPEQFRQPDSVTPATDIWSLGVVLYEMLTGVVPFDERTFPNLALRVAHGKFVPPSTLRPDLPRAVDVAIARALAVPISQRFANVEELSALFLRIVRANTSESVVRPDVMRALQGRATQPSNTEALAETEFLTSVPSSTRASKSWGVLLVVLCALVLLVSWLILERSERAANETDSAPHVMPKPPAPPPEPELAPNVAEVQGQAPPSPVPAPPVETAPARSVPPTQTSIQAATDARSEPAAGARAKRKRRVSKNLPASDGSSPSTTPDVSPVSPVPVAKESNYGF